MASFASYLPPLEGGWLPLFVLLTGVTAITNAFQCYRDITNIQRIYNIPSSQGAAVGKNDPKAVLNSSPATPLSARTFGTYNLAVGIVRLYAAYNLHERSWYQMSMWANTVAALHFGLEAFVYKTAKPSGPWLAPMGVALTGWVWHALQYGNYVK